MNPLGTPTLNPAYGRDLFVITAAALTIAFLYTLGVGWGAPALVVVVTYLRWDMRQAEVDGAVV